MMRFATVPAIVLALVSGASAAGTSCAFYVEPGFAGAGFTLYNGHALAPSADFDLSTRVPAGAGLNKAVDRSWAGRVVSVRVQSGCTAHVVGQGGSTPFRGDITNLHDAGSGSLAFACTCG